MLRRYFSGVRTKADLSLRETEFLTTQSGIPHRRTAVSDLGSPLSRVTQRCPETRTHLPRTRIGPHAHWLEPAPCQVTKRSLQLFTRGLLSCRRSTESTYSLEGSGWVGMRSPVCSGGLSGSQAGHQDRAQAGSPLKLQWASAWCGVSPVTFAVDTGFRPP